MSRSVRGLREMLPSPAPLPAIARALASSGRVLVPVLALSLAATAVAAAWSAHRTRMLYAELDHLQGRREALMEEQGRLLLLERGALSSLPRVEQVATLELGMVVPAPEQTLWVLP